MQGTAARDGIPVGYGFRVGLGFAVDGAGAHLGPVPSALSGIGGVEIGIIGPEGEIDPLHAACFIGGFFKGAGRPKALFCPGAEPLESRFLRHPEGHHRFGEKARADFVAVHDVAAAAERALHRHVGGGDGRLSSAALAADRPSADGLPVGRSVRIGVRIVEIFRGLQHLGGHQFLPAAVDAAHGLSFGFKRHLAAAARTGESLRRHPFCGVFRFRHVRPRLSMKMIVPVL